MRFNIWICGLSKVDCFPQWGLAIVQSLEGMNRTNGKRRSYFTLFSASQLKLDILSQPLMPLDWELLSSKSDWICTTRFAGSPTCRQQMVGLLRLHNFVSQFLIINAYYMYICVSIYPYIYIYTYTYYWFYFAGEL